MLGTAAATTPSPSKGSTISEGTTSSTPIPTGLRASPAFFIALPTVSLATATPASPPPYNMLTVTPAPYTYARFTDIATPSAV